ncbi:hypothetical protein [Sphingobacterium sp. WOUb80]|uniref:hypothetical protein n=1 Tax=Sphingobacterium sp. WOUb80 TaxID=3234028 RepID=UPI003CEC48DE
MTDTNKYLEKLARLQSEHWELKSTIREGMDELLQEVHKIYDQNQECPNEGILFIKSMNIIVSNYQMLSKIDPYFICYDDPEILFVKDALLALCKTWFTSIVVFSDIINFRVPAPEIRNVSQIMVQFLKDSKTDLDSLSYSEHLTRI